MYDELIAGRVYFGGADDTEQVVREKQVDKVMDVRVNGRVEPVEYTYIHKPIADESEHIADSIKIGVEEVVKAYEAGEKIYFHCGSGGGRAGVMAVATLMELGVAESLDEAELIAKQARPKVNIRPNMREALEKLYK
ncbi:protein-tyrosine phosphatase family protein [Lysinibacillus sp. LZ02]|uniref:protein-tyrosine phosphatase family protein n=1 Tax=Lysinibacillus sp. LZ02 TaxID=3420668 RepID=UPI003D361D58